MIELSLSSSIDFTSIHRMFQDHQYNKKGEGRCVRTNQFDWNHGSFAFRGNVCLLDRDHTVNDFDTVEVHQICLVKSSS